MLAGEKNHPSLILLMGKVCNKSPGEADYSDYSESSLAAGQRKELSETGVIARGVHKEAVLTDMDSSEFSGLCPASFSNI